MESHKQFTVEACFSPELYQYKLTRENFIVVVADILRATTSMCAAFHYGVKSIIPVGSIEEARQYKNNGYFVACERNGEILDFADAGNSPSDFLIESFKEDTVVFSTTNGTKAIHLASDSDEILIGSFVNIQALVNHIIDRGKNVVILCAAWKNLFNLEDSSFVGALSEKILNDPSFITHCDSVKAGLDLWSIAKNDLKGYLSKSSHRNRLKHLVSDVDFHYTITPDTTDVVPVFRNGEIKDLKFLESSL